ncbi:MAG: patatin-like phospholipase family protein [Actinomycetota bacterium]
MTTIANPTPFDAPLGGWPRPLAFALSGGGAFGSVQVGMIQALAAHGVHPDLIVGSSVGSLNGAVLAANPFTGPAVLGGIWSRMSRASVFGHGPIRAARNLVRTRTLSTLDALEHTIRTELGVPDFDELPIPFAAVVTNAITGEPELLTTGSLTDALLASSSIPGVFPPVEIDSQLYVDGGVAAYLPIRQAIAFGARSVVALDAGPHLPEARPRTFAGGLYHTVSMIIRNQRAHSIDDLTSRYPILVLPTITPADLGSFNFDHTPELIQSARAATSEVLASLTPLPR